MRPRLCAFSPPPPSVVLQEVLCRSHRSSRSTSSADCFDSRFHEPSMHSNLTLGVSCCCRLDRTQGPSGAYLRCARDRGGPRPRKCDGVYRSSELRRARQGAGEHTQVLIDAFHSPIPRAYTIVCSQLTEERDALGPSVFPWIADCPSSCRPSAGLKAKFV